MKKKTSVTLRISKTTITNLDAQVQANVKGGGPTIIGGFTALCTLDSFVRICPVSRTGIAGECCFAQ